MGWVKVDDSFFNHEKFIGLPPQDVGVWLILLCWSAQQRTNGVIPGEIFVRLVDQRSGKPSRTRLVKAGILVESGADLVIKNFTKWQTSKEEIEEIIEKRRQAGVASGESRRTKREHGVQFCSNTPGTHVELEYRRRNRKEENSDVRDSSPASGGPAPNQDEDPRGPFWLINLPPYLRHPTPYIARYLTRYTQDECVAALEESRKLTPGMKPSWESALRYLDQSRWDNDATPQ